MVVIYDGPTDAEGSYDIPLQPVGPFWMLEYVSKSNRRKDYDDNMQKYEHELKVPYYLLFTPDQEELTLYRRVGERFVSVPPDENGRCLVEGLHIGVALLDGWVRYWYQGELLPLPADLLRDLEKTQRQLADAIRRGDAEARRADEEREKRVALERELAGLRQKKTTN